MIAGHRAIPFITHSHRMENPFVDDYRLPEDPHPLASHPPRSRRPLSQIDEGPVRYSTAPTTPIDDDQLEGSPATKVSSSDEKRSIRSFQKGFIIW